MSNFIKKIIWKSITESMFLSIEGGERAGIKICRRKAFEQKLV